MDLQTRGEKNTARSIDNGTTVATSVFHGFMPGGDRFRGEVEKEKKKKDKEKKDRTLGRNCGRNGACNFS